MVGLFYIYLPMSFSIPAQIEQDFISGRAHYQTFQTGNGGQSVLPVAPNSYIVIFGMTLAQRAVVFAINNRLYQITKLHQALYDFLKRSKLVFIPVATFFLLFTI